jgi:hypothetical protein
MKTHYLNKKQFDKLHQRLSEQLGIHVQDITQRHIIDNTKGRYLLAWSSRESYCFEFKNDGDAVMFALKWSEE